MKRFDVITIGSALRDIMFYSDDLQIIDNPSKDPTCKQLLGAEFGAKLRSDDVHFFFGGGASNTAVNFSGLGLRTAIFASIGNDLDGLAIRQELKKQGVHIGILQVSEKNRTGLSFLTVDSKTHEHVAYVFYGAAEKLAFFEKQWKGVSTEWFYISSLNMSKWKPLVHSIMDQQSRIAWNPGANQLDAGYKALKPFLQKTELLLLNTDEATQLILSYPGIKKTLSIRQMLRLIYSWGPRTVLITDGRKGAYAYDGKKVYVEKPPQDHVRDTTGAGDCFGSSFLTGIIRYNNNVEKAMQLAVRNTTSLVHSVGAQQGLLKWKDLPKKLRQL